MKRTGWLVVVLLMGCHSAESAPPSAPAPASASASASASAPASAPAAVPSTPREKYCAVLDGVVDGLAADVRAEAAKPGTTPEQAFVTVMRGVGNRLTRLLDEGEAKVGLTREEKETLEREHPDEVHACAERFEARLNELSHAYGDPRVLPPSKPEAPAGPPLPWRDDVDATLRAAAKAHKPALLSFHALWCGACGELDKRTFADPAVRADLASFALARADATDDEDRATNALKDKFHVVGLPTVICFDPRGREAKRVNEFMAPDAFRAVLAACRDAK